MSTQKELVHKFYKEPLTVNPGGNPQAILQNILADDFLSINTAEKKDKNTLMGQVQYFWKLMPNLQWIPQDILENGNKVIVRSVASGSPKGNFMGWKQKIHHDVH